MIQEDLRGWVPVLVGLVFVFQFIGVARTFRQVNEPASRFGNLPYGIAIWVLLFQAMKYGSPPWWFVPRFILGVALLAASVTLFAWAAQSISGRYFTYIFSTNQPDFLWTGGPFAYIRNPFYTSYLLSQVAVAVLVPNRVTLVTVGCMVIYFFFAARYEERKFRTSPLAAEYAAYCGRTGRFLPKLARRG